MLVNSNFNNNSYAFVTGPGGTEGDVGANGNLSLDHLNTIINGDAMATGAISITSITGNTTPGAAAYSFPPMSVAYYQGIADRTFTNLTLNGGTFSFLQANEVVCVTGNLDVNSATVISGTGTIFVTGNVNLTGDLAYADGNSRVAILANSNIQIQTATSLVGLFYASDISADNGFTLTGSLVANTFNNWNGSGVISITRDTGVTPSVGQAMSLPGY